MLTGAVATSNREESCVKVKWPAMSN